MNSQGKSKKEIEQIIDKLIESIREVDKKYPEIPKTEEFYKEEKRFIQDVIDRLELKAKQVAEFLHLLLEYPKSCECLKADFEHREGKSNFIFLLDLSEIYSVMHRYKEDTFWGATANSFLSEFKMHYFSMLPATVWEFLLYLKNLSDALNRYLSETQYRNLLSDRTVSGLLEISEKKGRLHAYDHYLKSGGLSETIQLISDRRFEQMVTGPISTFLRLVRNDRIRPLRNLGITMPSGKKLQEKVYNELYEDVTKRLMEVRPQPEKKISNIIDALNFCEAIILNDIYSPNWYFMFISRGRPLRVFRSFTWLNDPIRNQVKEMNATIARSTQYAFYHVKIDNAFVEIRERLDFVQKCLELFSSSFISSMRSITELLLANEKNLRQALGESAFKLLEMLSPIVGEGRGKDTPDIDSMQEFIQILSDRRIFNEKLDVISKSLKNSAREMRNSLRAFLPARKIELLEPDLAEVEQWLDM